MRIPAQSNTEQVYLRYWVIMPYRVTYIVTVNAVIVWERCLISIFQVLRQLHGIVVLLFWNPWSVSFSIVVSILCCICRLLWDNICVCFLSTWFCSLISVFLFMGHVAWSTICEWMSEWPDKCHLVLELNRWLVIRHIVFGPKLLGPPVSCVSSTVCRCGTLHWLIIMHV